MEAAAFGILGMSQRQARMARKGKGAKGGGRGGAVAAAAAVKAPVPAALTLSIRQRGQAAPVRQGLTDPTRWPGWVAEFHLTL